MLVEAERAAEEEEGSDDCMNSRVLDIVITLAYANRFLHQHGTHLGVRDRARRLVQEVARLQYDTGLDEHKGQEGSDEAI